MKKIMLALLSAGVALSAVPAAYAAQGCGIGFHRGPYGHCRRNFGPGPAYVAPRAVIAPGLAIGVFYPGRGYWDGHRYWANRYRYGGGWRYR